MPPTARESAYPIAFVPLAHIPQDMCEQSSPASKPASCEGVKAPKALSGAGTSRKAHRMRFTTSFLLVCYGLAISSGFLLGIISVRFVAWKHTIVNQSSLSMLPEIMPIPTLPVGKDAPQNNYISKHFQSKNIKAKSDDVLLSRENSWVEISRDGNEIVVDESLHEPSGQHLIIDIEHVDAAFLNSEKQLAEAMVQLIDLSGLTMLSYHCHALSPMGVTCVGVLLESHVSFHTWPIPGVITLDIFTCGDSDLLPLLGTIERLFGVSQQPAVDAEPKKLRMLWGHKMRGFRSSDSDYSVDVDLDSGLLGNTQLTKGKIVEVETDFQNIAIYDIHDRFHTHDVFLESKNMSTYWGQHPDLARPDRRIYLDSVVQSRRYGDAAYHETLVHPALLTHPSPKRIAILGGGEGATLREALKHDTVTEVVMIEIDAEMVEVCKKYIPEWSDCSAIENSAASCFDDPRTTLYTEDAMNWFISRYGDKTASEISAQEKFDVIIMDVLDPETNAPFSDLIYRNEKLSAALSTSLGDDGIFVLQQGQAPEYSDPAAELIGNGRLEDFTNNLVKFGFESQHEYDEGHGGFEFPWSFFISLKDEESHRSRFLTMNQAEMDLEIRRRLRRSTSGESLLKYMDGASFMHYQFPGRATEELYCRTEPQPESCSERTMDPDLPHFPRSQFEVKQSTVALAGRGVFALQDIPKGSYLSMESMVHHMFVPPSTYRVLKNTTDTLANHPYFQCMFKGYTYGYGWIDSSYGEEAAGVDPDIFTFTNHGCNGTYNAGIRTAKTEMTITEDELEEIKYDRKAFDPVSDRRFPEAGYYQALRDIPAGDELLDNYLLFIEAEDIQGLAGMCNGKVGIISRYEKKNQ